MRALYTLIVLFTLTACQNTPTNPTLPAPHFADGRPLRLSVSEIKIADDYEFVNKSPNIEHSFNYPPSEVLKTWINEKLKASAPANHYIEVSIIDASVKKQDLSKTPGLKGIFTNDQTEKLDAHMVVEMRLYEEGKTISIADARAEASRSITVAENASLNEREQIHYDLTNALVKDVGQELEKQIRLHFPANVIR